MWNASKAEIEQTKEAPRKDVEKMKEAEDMKQAAKMGRMKATKQEMTAMLQELFRIREEVMKESELKVLFHSN